MAFYPGAFCPDPRGGQFLCKLADSHPVRRPADRADKADVVFTDTAARIA